MTAPSTVIVPLAFGAAASAATFLGGTIGLRLAGRIGLVLGLTAGIVIGVAMFDLLPEAAQAAQAAEAAGGGLANRIVPLWLAIGFAGYMLVRRAGTAFGRAAIDAHLAPAMLTLHSLMDGIIIGIGFQVSPTVGGLVAAAVLTHDVADGVNMVSLCLATGRQGSARAWLTANGAAPLLGVVIGLTVRVPPVFLAPLLAAFAGAFLFIGACELLPRSHALDQRLRTTAASVAGLALMLLVTTLAR